MTPVPVVSTPLNTRTDEPPWHEFCGCRGCRIGERIGRRAVAGLAQREGS